MRSNRQRQPVNRAAEAMFRQNFDKVARMPFAWRMTAESLLRAARALVPLMQADNRASLDPMQNTFDPPVTPVYMLLAGLVIENLAKARLVAERSSPATVGEDLAGDLKTHNLIDLLDRARLTLTADESHLAERLQAFVEWAGRYPIPATLESQLPGTHPLGGSGPLNYFLGSDPAAIEAIAARLMEPIGKELPGR